jgi:hypothetical protein
MAFKEQVDDIPRPHVETTKRDDLKSMEETIAICDILALNYHPGALPFSLERISVPYDA